ncbi:MAG: hypothetical protein ACLVO2_18115 [Clostridia bacterium]
MALIKCPECKREVSDKAEACIHCGYPIAKLNSIESIPVAEVANVFRAVPAELKALLKPDAPDVPAFLIFDTAPAASAADSFSALFCDTARKSSSDRCGFRFSLLNVSAASVVDKSIKLSRILLKPELLPPLFSTSANEEKSSRPLAASFKVFNLFSDKCVTWI